MNPYTADRNATQQITVLKTVVGVARVDMEAGEENEQRKMYQSGQRFNRPWN